MLAVLVDAEGTVVDRVLAKTQHSGPQDVADHVSRLVAKLDPGAAIDSVGVGMPGVISGSTVAEVTNLRGWDEPVDFGSLVATSTGRRVVLGNDVSMAALAEHRYGNARGVDNVLHIAVGTGVGGALILDGQLRSGSRGLAGEIGHTAVPAFPGSSTTVRQGGVSSAAVEPLSGGSDQAGGPHRDVLGDAPLMCACGGVGHLEAYLGRASLERRARAAYEHGVSTLLVDAAGDRRMTSTIWVDALAAGDDLAHQLLDDASQALAGSITAAVTLLDLELVVLGGGFASRLGGEWRQRIAILHQAAMTIGRPATIKGSGIGDNAAALGAALSQTTPNLRPLV